MALLTSLAACTTIGHMCMVRGVPERARGRFPNSQQLPTTSNTQLPTTSNDFQHAAVGGTPSLLAALPRSRVLESGTQTLGGHRRDA